MKARFEELEKLEGAFDIEVDIPEGERNTEDIPVTTSIIEDEKE